MKQIAAYDQTNSGIIPDVCSHLHLDGANTHEHQCTLLTNKTRQITKYGALGFIAQLNGLGLVYTSLLCRTFVASNAIQTIDNEMLYLIIYCLNCI